MGQLFEVRDYVGFGVWFYKYLRWLKEAVDKKDLDMIHIIVRWMEEYAEEWFPWNECFGDPVCYVSKARVGSGHYCVRRTHVGFLADWWMEFDELPLIDENLLRWVIAVSLTLSSHNVVSNIGLGISKWRNEVWRVHLILKCNEENDAVGSALLIALSMWLGDVWGAEVEVSNMSYAESTVITFLFDDFRKLPEFIKELVRYAGYNLDVMPRELMVGRLGV